MQIFINILLFIAILSLLVIVHELGHLLFAKIFKVYCFEFSVGMGPRILTFKKGETRFSLKLFPIGGSVAMAGEELDSKDEENPEYQIDVPKERTVYGIAKWKRLFIMGGGAAFNLIFGLIVVFIATIAIGVANTRPVINVLDDSLAYQSGLRSNDQIKYLELNNSAGELIAGDEINYYSDIQVTLNKGKLSEEKEISYIFTTTTDTSHTITLTCLGENCADTPIFGISNTLVKLNFIDTITHSFSQFSYFSVQIILALSTLFTPSGLNNVSGPIGIFTMSTQVASFGIGPYLSFLALLSINLGIFNLIPFPGLDGSVLFITLGEMITRKELDKRIKNIISISGLILLLLLIVVVTVKDIMSLSTLISNFPLIFRR